MTAERDPVTLNESSVPALGASSLRSSTLRAGRARPTPDPEVVAKPKRRQFTAQYRLRILEEAERCTQPGEVGRLLRREGLYSSHLTAWRKARRQGSLLELAPKKRGAKPGERNPLDAKVQEKRRRPAPREAPMNLLGRCVGVQPRLTEEQRKERDCRMWAAIIGGIAGKALRATRSRAHNTQSGGHGSMAEHNDSGRQGGRVR